MNWLDEIHDLEKQKEEARQLGGPEAIEKLHGKGKLTARERLDVLLDPDSFEERGILAKSIIETPGKAPKVVPADGVICGYGKIRSRKVFVASDDATIMAGARGDSAAAKVLHLKQTAVRERCPFIMLAEGSASRIQESMTSAFAASWSMREAAQVSGIIPQVVALMGNCFGGSAFLSAMSDFVPIVKGTAFMGMSGPPVVFAGIGEKVTAEELGGSTVHYSISGQVDYEASSERDCLEVIKEYLSYLPQSCWELPPEIPTEDRPDRKNEKLLDLVPLNLNQPYDMNRVIAEIVDVGKFFPLKMGFGPNLITCLARLNGTTVGIIANQPMYLAGCLDWKAAYKLRRFIELCDAFNIPLIFLEDVPGFLVGKEVEKNATIRYAVSSIMSLSYAKVPKLTVILRKAYGLAYHAMGGKNMGVDLIVAWPSASIALMGPYAGVNVIYQKELEKSENPEELRATLQEHLKKSATPQKAAELFAIDDIIDPRDTRSFLAKGLEMVAGSRKHNVGPKHPIWP